MKVLFIGGSGTLSSACASHCWKEGVDLWVFVRGTRDERIARKDRIIHGDIKKGPIPQSVIGQAWDCVVDWVVYDEGDILRDYELFKSTAKKYIYISTTSLYKKPLPPQPVNEETPAGNDYLPYAERKLAAERVLLQLHKEKKFPAVILRMGHVYSDFVPITAIQGLGFGLFHRMLAGKPILVHDDGAGIWSPLYNEDFARLFVSFMKADQTIGNVFQLTSEERLTWNGIYELTARALGCKANFTHVPSQWILERYPEMGATLVGDKACSYIFDNSKIKKHLPTWGPFLSYAEGVKKCADYFMRNRQDIPAKPELDRMLDDMIDDYASGKAEADQSRRGHR